MTDVLKLEHVTKRFGGLTAVGDVSFTIEEGEIFGLIGPNGAGKTTIFNLITGVYTLTEGEISFYGEKLAVKDPYGDGFLDGLKRRFMFKALKPYQIAQKGITRTFQNIRLFKDMSVKDNVKVGLHNHHPYSTLEGILRLPRYFKVEKEMDERAMELLKVFDLDQEADLLASNLPYGKQRKLEIARALATDPKLLLLDEPAAGMNPNETKELMDTIRFVRDKFDMTILLIEHDMKLVSGICEKLTVLNFGEVLMQGDTSTVLNDPQVITAYLGE